MNQCHRRRENIYISATTFHDPGSVSTPPFLACVTRATQHYGPPKSHTRAHSRPSIPTSRPLRIAARNRQDVPQTTSRHFAVGSLPPASTTPIGAASIDDNTSTPSFKAHLTSHRRPLERGSCVRMLCRHSLDGVGSRRHVLDRANPLAATPDVAPRFGLRLLLAASRRQPSRPLSLSHPNSGPTACTPPTALVSHAHASRAHMLKAAVTHTHGRIAVPRAHALGSGDSRMRTSLTRTCTCPKQRWRTRAHLAHTSP